MSYLLQTPYVPLIAATLAVNLATHIYKAAMHAARLRHHWLVERTLPLVPAVIGCVVFGLFPHELGIKAIVKAGHHSIHGLGAFFGAGLGFVSSGVFRAVVGALPGSSKIRQALTVAQEPTDAEGTQYG